MTRGTTPLHTFTLPKDVSEYSNFIITYRQNSGTVLEKKPEQCLVEGKEIKVRLTQEETLLFDSGQKAFVQIRVINEEGVAEASGVFSFPVNSVLNETILQDGEIPDYATSQDILYGKVAYAGGIKLTGEIEVRAASDELITEKGQVEIFPSGYYSEQNTVRIDPTEQAKIIPENIIETANILGVQGTAHPCEEFDDENRTARVAFSDETVLEISQQGSGIKGLNGNTDGLYAKNINTGEDTGEVIATQNEQIAEQGEEIDTLTEQNTELQAENATLTAENAELTERLEEALSKTKLYTFPTRLNFNFNKAGYSYLYAVRLSSLGGCMLARYFGVAEAIIDYVGGFMGAIFTNVPTSEAWYPTCSNPGIVANRYVYTAIDGNNYWAVTLVLAPQYSAEDIPLTDLNIS